VANGPELECPRLLRNLRIRPCGVCWTGLRYDFLTKNKRSLLPAEVRNPPGPDRSLANVPVSRVQPKTKQASRADLRSAQTNEPDLGASCESNQSTMIWIPIYVIACLTFSAIVGLSAKGN
jgi:hypothetical protein